MTDLDKLIKAVEGGFAPLDAIDKMKLFGLPSLLNNNLHEASHAYRGSLDAAKALHEALLPGWGVETAVSGGHSSALVFLDGYRDDYSEKWETLQGENVARAWLISILKAYRSRL